MKHFENDLKDLKAAILEMGGFVESAVENAVQATVRKLPAGFKRVFEVEALINQSHLDVDRRCLALLATHAPMAIDLRLILGVIKINTDLERMGDQACNIAHNGKHFHGQVPTQMMVDLNKMAKNVQAMIRDSLDAFVRGDVSLAREVLIRDDEVDAAKRKILDEAKEWMLEDTTHVEDGLTMILIARNLERLGDHATNIAEDVIFVSTGEDVRHSKGQPQK
jgi:phosphate transport system protein